MWGDNVLEIEVRLTLETDDKGTRLIRKECSSLRVQDSLKQYQRELDSTSFIKRH